MSRVRPPATLFGNQAHLCPDVIRARSPGLPEDPAPTLGDKCIDYSHQAVFAAGMLLAELATGHTPLPDYPYGQEYCSPSVTDAASLHPPTRSPYIAADRIQFPEATPNGYPSGFVDLIRSMLSCDHARTRPSLVKAWTAFADMFELPCRPVAVRVSVL